MYYDSYMSVAVNCQSNPEKMVHYSGPYHLEGQTVVHKVRNAHSSNLIQNFRRLVEMSDQNQLDLVGPFGEDGKAVVSWGRLLKKPSSKDASISEIGSKDESSRSISTKPEQISIAWSGDPRRGKGISGGGSRTSRCGYSGGWCR